MELVTTKDYKIFILENSDSNDLKTLVSSEELIKSVGRGLSDTSIKLFCNQGEKVQYLLNSIQSGHFDMKGNYVVLGCKLNGELICVIQVCDKLNGNITQCIAIDPKFKSYLKDIYDSYHKLLFNLSGVNIIRCSVNKNTTWEIDFILQYGYIRSSKDKSPDYYSYEITKDIFLK
jgi:hypothetical protein